MALMPVIVMAASACPPGLEATTYAAALTVLDLAASMSGYMVRRAALPYRTHTRSSSAAAHTRAHQGSILSASLGISQQDFSRLWLAVVLCTCGRFLPLLLFMPARDHIQRVVDAHAKAGDDRRKAGARSDALAASAGQGAPTAPASPQHVADGLNSERTALLSAAHAL